MADRRDPVDDALDDLRVAGTVLMCESYAAPWAIDIPDEAKLRQLLALDEDVRIVLFHFVRRGCFDLHSPTGEVRTITAPHVALCSTQGPLRMARGKGAKPLPIERVLSGNLPGQNKQAAGEVTELLCGAFYFNASPLNPLLGALPPLITVNTELASSSPLLAGAAWLIAHEADRGATAGFTMARLVEIFCAEAIKAYQRDQGSDYPGWFRGLADPRIAASIQQVHAAPGRAWTVPELAGTVALSGSRFAARFKAALGIPAMTYVSRWRANVACRLLHHTDLSLAEIASRVGYESLPAFNRAFRAQIGLPPAAWRMNRRRTGTPRAAQSASAASDFA